MGKNYNFQDMTIVPSIESYIEMVVIRIVSFGIWRLLDNTLYFFFRNERMSEYPLICSATEFYISVHYCVEISLDTTNLEIVWKLPNLY